MILFLALKKKPCFGEICKNSFNTIARVQIVEKQKGPYVLDVTQLPKIPAPNDVRLIAFYLPQYHPIPENDLWWGKGFTEWTNVTKAEPLFEGHYQPRLPADLGFYDLRVSEVREQQATLAEYYGIHGFCYYYYWFAGKRLLGRPIDEMLVSGKPDMPFCLCWANENWTRRWDGSEYDILMEQIHTSENNDAFARSVVPFLGDKRYIKVNGKPILLVYRADIIPDIENALLQWRDIFRECEVGEVHLCGVLSFGVSPTQHKKMGFDASVEFPPHNNQASMLPPQENGMPSDFIGSVYDYNDAISCYLAKPMPQETLYPGVITGWDNTARKGKAAYFFLNSSPERYEVFLRGAIEKAKTHANPDNQLVFINAWNEWAEGTYLEPDRKNGHRFLIATSKALNQAQDFDGLLDVIGHLADTLAIKQLKTLITELVELNPCILNAYVELQKMSQQIRLRQLVVIENKTHVGNDDYVWHIETPSTGLKVSRGNIIVSGWFLCRTKKFENVDVVIYSANEKLTSNKLCVVRQDVFDYFQSGSEICGFIAQAPASKCGGELRVYATTIAGDIGLGIIKLQINSQELGLPGYLAECIGVGCIKNEDIKQALMVLPNFDNPQEIISLCGRLKYANEVRNSAMFAMEKFILDNAGASIFPDMQF